MPDHIASIPAVLLCGSPVERGRQHGARFREEIAAAIASMAASETSAKLAVTRQRAEAAWPLIRDLAPSIAGEIAGIAEGSGSTVLDILLRIGFEFFDEPTISGCSAIAVSGPDGAIVAQNWDAPPKAEGELVFFLHVGPGGFEQAVVAAYGGLCWVGGNRHGLALVNNDLMLASRAGGLPSQIVRRIVLDEPHVAGAVDKLRALPHMAGRSYLLGDASGAVAGIEVSPRCGVHANQRRSPVLHTNHALDPHIKADEEEALLQATYPSSRRRYDMLRRGHMTEPSVGAVAALLSDKTGHPDAICKSASVAEPTATAFSAIFDCGKRTVFLCPGRPGDDAYQPFHWPG